MSRKQKQFAVIGLGRFGSSIAMSLCSMGYEVLAIDADEHRVHEIADEITHAVQADATDEDAMRALGLRNFDVVIVAIGNDIQSSILAAIILKDMGIPKVVAKAQNELHGKVLKKIGVDQVIFPERDMGLRVAQHLVTPNLLDMIELSDEYSIVELKAPKEMIGRTLRQLDIRAKYGCSVMALKTGNHMNISPNADDVVKEEDILIVVGTNEQLGRMGQAFGE